MLEQRSDVPWGFADFTLVILCGYLSAIAVTLLATFGGLEAGPTIVIGAVAMASGLALGCVAVTRRRSASLADLGFVVEPSDGLYLLGGVGLQLALAIAFAPIAEFVQSDGPTQVVANEISGITALGSRIAIVLSVGLLTPIAEELTFRGVLLHATRRRLDDRGAQIVTAAIFSVLHWLGIEGGNTWAGLVTLAQLFIVGWILARVTVRTRRLGPAIFMHAGFNTLTLLTLFFPTA
ncbi:MAG: CPBP family intramembrane metalloprotease [Acidimicrobiia bacterium]|nr:CPBP family intramembrane metalloprotease [Acidimicrobiia bacterium]